MATQTNFTQLLKALTKTLVLLVFVSACSDNSVIVAEDKNYEYAAPKFSDDGWQVGHLSDVGINPAQITQLVAELYEQPSYGIDSISIVKNNTLVLHEDIRTNFSIYDDWIGNESLERHLVHSTSKSFVSSLLGIAIDQGYIQSTEQPLISFFDYSNYQNWQASKEQITLNDTLTMRLGLTWNEWDHAFNDDKNSLVAATTNSDDYIKSMLDLPMLEQPGSHYAYNTLASIALGAVIENSSGIALEDFADYYLFDPLQFDKPQWLTTPEGYPNTGSGLFLKTRDIAKLGQLYLDDGSWNGTQIISKQWIEQSLNQHVKLNWEYTTGYGYQWWLGEFNLLQKIDGQETKAIPFYSARGFGGQLIVVIPDYEMVIAITAQNYANDQENLPLKLIEDFILPAVELS